MFFANWLGNNTPANNKIMNMTITSFYVMNATAIKNNTTTKGSWLINYSFYLNGTSDSGDYSKLPYFMSQLLDSSNNTISNRNAYESGIWTVSVNRVTTETLKIVLDNEIINLGTFTSTKTPTQLDLTIVGDAKINKTIKLIAKLSYNQEIPNETIIFKLNGKIIGTATTNSEGIATLEYTIPNAGLYSFSAEYMGNGIFTPSLSNILNLVVKEEPTPNPIPIPESNKTSNNPVASATMKTTGIPIIPILIVLLTSLGLIARRKQ